MGFLIVGSNINSFAFKYLGVVGWFQDNYGGESVTKYSLVSLGI